MDELLFFDDLRAEIISRFNTEVEKLANKIALIIKRETKQVIGENILNAVNLQKSVEKEVKKSAGEYLIKIFSNVQYGQFVDTGTKPHFPPVLPIREWVLKNKLPKNPGFRSRNKGKPKNLINNHETNEQNEINKIAFLIARKISKKGTKGIKFFDLALKQAMPDIENELKNFRL